jgi:putative transposase
MILNKLGQIACGEWMKLPQRFQNLELDVFQIMPNHMHGIIILNDVRAGLAPAPNINRAGVNPAPTVGAIIGAYKSIVSNECLKIFKSKNEKMGKIWQRDYYEHIIRNEISLFNISEYIINNPVNWVNDDWVDPPSGRGWPPP